MRSVSAQIEHMNVIASRLGISPEAPDGHSWTNPPPAYPTPLERADWSDDGMMSSWCQYAQDVCLRSGFPGTMSIPSSVRDDPNLFCELDRVHRSDESRRRLARNREAKISLISAIDAWEYRKSLPEYEQLGMLTDGMSGEGPFGALVKQVVHAKDLNAQPERSREELMHLFLRGQHLRPGEGLRPPNSPDMSTPTPRPD